MLLATAVIVVLTTLASNRRLWLPAGDHRPARSLLPDSSIASPYSTISSPRSAALRPKASCPKVFVYNISRVRPHEQRLTDLGYGNRVTHGPTWLRDGGQHRLGAIILSRLLRSSRCLTHNASEAELFFVPMLHVLHPPPAVSDKVLNEESQVVWSKMPPSMSGVLWPLCSRFLYEDWHRTLPHLTTKNVARHVMLNEEFFQIFGFCINVPEFQAQLRGAPNLALLQSMSWLGNSAYYAFGFRFHNLAYPSSVHLRAHDDPPWRAGYFNRTTLMMFGASMHGR